MDVFTYWYWFISVLLFDGCVVEGWLLGLYGEGVFGVFGGDGEVGVEVDTDERVSIRFRWSDHRIPL